MSENKEVIGTVSDLAPPVVGKMFGALTGTKSKKSGVDD